MKQLPEQEAAVEQRRGLRSATTALEAVVQGPTSDAQAWGKAVLPALGDVRRAWVHHTEFTESADGLFAEIIEQAPRLMHAVRNLEAEHHTVLAAIGDCENATLDAAQGSGTDSATTQIMDLLAAIARHRDRGAELVYDAYTVDISPGD